MSLQINIRHTLLAKYGNESEFPNWTQPFIHAVGLLEALEDLEVDPDDRSNWIPPESRREGEGSRSGPTNTERQMERIGEEVVTSLESVSFDGISFCITILFPSSRQAIELSLEEIALPFIWLANFYIQIEDWSKARPPALKASQLEPFSSSSLLRLSLCYENEREYIKAYDHLLKGMSLMTPLERKSLSDKQARLREQSDDMAAHVVRKDPFEVLPLELVIHIMQIGMEARRDMVLNCTFVSKTWRQTLIHKCPELWGTLSFCWRHLRDKKYDGKLEHWLNGCNRKPHTVDVLEGMTLGGVGKMPKDMQWTFSSAKNLRLEMKDNKVIQRFSDKFSYSFYSLEHLVIDGGLIDSIREEDEAFNTLHCNLLDLSAYSKIKTMVIRNVDFRDRFVIEYAYLGGMIAREMHNLDTRRRSYPSLESLVLQNCKFDTVENPGEVSRHMKEYKQLDRYSMDDDDESSDEADPSEGRNKDCPLHMTLRSAPNLREFKISCHRVMFEGRFDRPQTQPKPEERVQLPQVVRLTIPPVSVWTIDMHTPNVQSLDFTLSYRMAPSTAYMRAVPMIPMLEESPVDIDNLTKITHLGFECAKSDTADRLVAWLSRVPNLTSLSIRGNKLLTNAVPARSDTNSTYRSDAVSDSLLEALIDLSESIPKLETLDIADCHYSDELVEKFVKMRKETPGMAPLTKLVLRGCKMLSPATHARLHKAVESPTGQSGYDHDGRYIFGCSFCEV